MAVSTGVQNLKLACSAVLVLVGQLLLVVVVADLLVHTYSYSTTGTRTAVHVLYLKVHVRSLLL